MIFLFLYTILFQEGKYFRNLIIHEGKVKSSSLANNKREIWEKRLLGRDPDRSWCHFHTSVKLFWSQPMVPWTLAAAYECVAAQSMESSAATKKALSYSQCDGNTSSCPGSYLTVACPEFHVRQAESFSPCTCMYADTHLCISMNFFLEQSYCCMYDCNNS